MNSLRHQRFIDKASSRLQRVHPSSLPPTKSAAKYHSYRVYLQIREWKNTSNSMMPEEWGWKKEGDEFVPIQMSANGSGFA